MDSFKIIVLLVFFSLFCVAEMADGVLVDKSESTLYLMKAGKPIQAFHVVFGANPQGHKAHEGDERTPEGNYTLDYKNSHSGFYKSIHISYPSKADRKKAAIKGLKPGGAIFIHGQKNGFEWLSFVSGYFNWTKGCIAVQNDEMDEIWKAVKPGIPIEIRP